MKHAALRCYKPSAALRIAALATSFGAKMLFKKNRNGVQTYLLNFCQILSLDVTLKFS
mgnify:CR=1 FL=1